MNWNKYYQAPLTLEGLLGNLHGQKEFLSEIYSSGSRKILEVGTGSGAMGIFFSWLGLEVTSIDIDPEVINRARRESDRFNGHAKFEVADALHLPYPNDSFDLVFHQGLLEHFSDEDIHKILGEQLRVARRVILSVPNQWYPQKDFGDERLMSKSQWDRLLAPFRIVKSYYYSPKRFPHFWIWRAPVQYLAIIEKYE